MIRLSVKSDKKGIISLWQEAFGDSAEAVELFLKHKYIPENTVICEENGKVASMLFLLDGKLNIKSEKYNAYYLYAAATLKEFRGRGIMAEMLDFSKKLAAERNFDFICLKPAEDSLYGYYKRFGYKEIFSTKTVKINSVIKSDSDIQESSSKADTDTIRNRVYKNTDYFEWDKASIEYAIRQHNYYGGNTINSCKGYVLYTALSDNCHVKELCFTQESLLNILSELQAQTGFIEISVELPCDFCLNGYDYEIHKNGMAVAVSEKAESIIEDLNGLYLNLTLD